MQNAKCKLSNVLNCRAILQSAICISQFAIPLLFTGCAGYQIGQRSLFRPDIRTVHVPVIQSNSYRRYLEHTFCEAFNLQGTPLRIEFKAGKNPFEGRTRPLTEAEQRTAHRARIRGRRQYG
jgi:hypothetical protein